MRWNMCSQASGERIYMMLPISKSLNGDFQSINKEHPSGCFLFYIKITNLIIALNIQKIGGAKIITE